MLETEEGRGALDACVAQVHFHPCQVRKLEAWEDQSLLKAFSLVSGGTRILTEVCVTCLQMCCMDFHVAVHSHFPEFLSSARSCSWLSLFSFLISMYFYKLKYFLQPFWRYHTLYQEILIYTSNECLTSEKYISIFLSPV